MRHGTLGAASPREFYAMRAARILPCLLLSVSLLVALNAAGVPSFTNGDIWTRVFYALTFRSNIYHVNHGGKTGILAWDVLWSLSVEEVFYLAFPLVCRLYKKTIYICIMLFIIIVNGPWYRHDYYVTEGSYSCIFMYLGNFDAIAIGCLTAIVSARHSLASGRAAAWVAACGVLLVFGSMIGFPIYSSFVIGPTCVALGAGVYLFAVHGRMSRPDVPWPLRPVVAFVSSCGVLSYELYLYHGFIVVLVLGLLNWLLIRGQWPVAMAAGCTAVFWAVTFCLSLAIHRCYAEPLGRALRRGLGARQIPSGARQ